MTSFIAALLVLGGLVLLALALRPLFERQRRAADERTARAADQWERALTEAQSPGVCLVRVVRVYQNASTGTKAIVEHRPNGRQQDAWFARRRVKSDAVLLMRGHSGYGPHNQNPHVLYVGDGQIIDLLPKDAERCWRRRCAERLSAPLPRPPQAAP